MRRILLASLLAGSAWTVHAEPLTWDFTYTGFLNISSYTDREGSRFTEIAAPAHTLTGSFAGSDADGNGMIELAELTMLIVRGQDYFACMASPSPYHRCGIDRFTYALTGELDFSVGWRGNDEYFSGWSGGVTSGVASTFHTYGPFSEETNDFLWTDATRLSIVPAPVPEPASALMAAAGAAVLAGLRYRRRRACRVRADRC